MNNFIQIYYFKVRGKEILSGISQNEWGGHCNGSLGRLAFTEVGKVASRRSILVELWELGQHLFPSCWSFTVIIAKCD